MEKSEESLKKDALLHQGKIWVRDASFDLRQGSGVRFGGKYMTIAEYNLYRVHRGSRHGH